jgi:molecular chaperone GrpE
MNDQNPNTEENTLEQELQDMTNMAKRAMADLQNYKRQVEEERKTLMTMSKVTILSEILPAIDNLQRALNHIPENLQDNEWTKGIEAITKQLEAVLTNSGLEVIETEGTADPNMHEVVTAIPGEQDQIMEVIEVGYKVGDKVIRPAKVVVGNGQ